MIVRKKLPRTRLANPGSDRYPSRTPVDLSSSCIGLSFDLRKVDKSETGTVLDIRDLILTVTPSGADREEHVAARHGG
jgi:hypothetical protein